MQRMMFNFGNIFENSQEIIRIVGIIIAILVAIFAVCAFVFGIFVILKKKKRLNQIPTKTVMMMYGLNNFGIVEV